jgi:hypothetical protein
MRLVVMLITAFFVLVPVGSALARPPREDELAGLRSVIEKLEREVRAAEAAAREAMRDRDREFLAAYKAGHKGDSDDHKKVVEIMDTKAFTKEKPGIRGEAAGILKERWSINQRNTLRNRKEISKHLLRLLSSSHDERSNALAIDVLYAFWGTHREYRLKDSWRDKNKAITKWRRFLSTR